MTTAPLDLPLGDLVFGMQPSEGRGRQSTQGHAMTSPGALMGRRRTFRFLSAFKWEMRKGWDRLLEAYLQVGCLCGCTLGMVIGTVKANECKYMPYI